VRLLSTENSAAEQIRKQANEEMTKLRRFYDKRNNSNSNTLAVDSSPFSTPTFFSSPSHARDFIDQHVSTILFDCDGVLYRSPDAICGAAKCLEYLTLQNKTVLFVTNNAAQSRLQLRDKLHQILQLPKTIQLSEKQMITASYAAAQYLQNALPTTTTTTTDCRRRVFVIGSQGLVKELEQHGFQVIVGRDIIAPNSSNNNNNNKMMIMTRENLADFDFDYHFPDELDAVVVGHDVTFDFAQLTIATNLLCRYPQSLFIATNRDAFDLVGSSSSSADSRRYFPGNGSLVAALECASQRKATNVGKPSSILTQLLLLNNKHSNNNNYKIHLPSSLMVGDRLDTDIQFGINGKMMYTALVMTGVTTAETVQEVVMTMKTSRQNTTSSDDDSTTLLTDTAENESLPLPSHIIPHVGWLCGWDGAETDS
jgi:phosphoglycolate/pyridoxal phosphate phosphatase family enzyme